MCCSLLQCDVLCCNLLRVLQCVAVECAPQMRLLSCVIVWCSAVQYVAVCSSWICSVNTQVVMYIMVFTDLRVCCSVLHGAVCCSVLQCVAVCCSVLQCAACCGIHRYMCQA